MCVKAQKAKSVLNSPICKQTGVFFPSRLVQFYVQIGSKTSGITCIKPRARNEGKLLSLIETTVTIGELVILSLKVGPGFCKLIHCPESFLFFSLSLNGQLHRAMISKIPHPDS